ncbi:ral guanine nucleotide dissociation stimulator-like 2 isoform X2 [Phycodurus eques]|uniref:ral guanine nucleotide dissociation stimulator-like 2 isoform X2 n=1 Tax=Phycodurus eques TaxID=693459 RepID=UPI002ACEA862|nr:ral guanine nucleotide dissociation stimulator-like 2 isoform X2 [Phycodurus eques]
MQDVSVDDQRARKRMDALAPPSGRLLVVSSSDVTLSERERERAEKSESPISCSQEHSGHADKRRKEGKEDDSAPSPAHRHRHRQRHPPLTDGRSSRSFLRELPHVVASSPMKTTWYCPPEQSTVVEEEEDGMIYTVVLKQAAGSPTTAGASRCRLAKAGTEDKLALHLLRAFALGDASFVSIFLATYRSFSSTQRVLDVLADRLERPPGDGDRSRRGKSFDRAACSVFSAWLSEYPEDFGRLKDPSRLLRLAPLLPRDSPSAADLRARVLRVAEELSEKALLPDAYRDANISGGPSADAREFEATAVLGFPSAVVAEQLTRIETDLFVRVVPYDCLGCVWSQRDKKGHEGACGSVRATVRQFNRLANAVLASCLGSAALRGQQRAKLLEKWIGVAQACRARKNFSSLYAIVSALQSNPIHRLRRTWQDTDREATRRFEELREIFSDKDNYSQSRELLKEWSVGAQGTVPYLGLFLTDLTMLDAAVKDRLENGYVNFDKRRREFEVLAQIRLLQSSCKNCALVPDETFLRWYRGVPTLTQEQSYSLSNEIEAPCDVAPAPRGGGPPTVVITQCPDLGGSASGPPSDADAPFDFSSPVNNLLSKLTKHMRSPSVSCLDVDTSPPPPPVDGSPAPGTPPKSHRRSASCGNNPPPALAAAGGCRSSGPDMRIIRIRMDLHDGNLYRSILVTSDDKTPAAIGSALEKHNQDPAQASAYELLQLLPEGKELLIPATGNVFYAMTSSSVDFLLQRKAGDASLGSPAVGQSESGAAATYPRIKAKGRRLARNLF